MTPNPKYILTADDYGFCDQVDDGIIEAATNGYITSVAAFVNGPDSIKRLKRLKQVQDQLKAEGKHLDIGCHLTITSGRPLLEATSDDQWKFVNGKGYFRKFTNMKFPKRNDPKFQQERSDALRKELIAQIELMESEGVGINVSNLSSHHNSLTFIPEYFSVLLDIAIQKKIPIRSFRISPEKKENNYQLQWRTRLRDNMNAETIKDAKDFFRTVSCWMAKQKEVRGDIGFPTMPDGIDGTNYGPLPIFPTREILHVEKARRKSEETAKAILNVSNGETMEFCFHLCHKNTWRRSQINYNEKRIGLRKNAGYYPGVDPKYFYGRRMEFMSLEGLHRNLSQGIQHRAEAENPQVISWSELKEKMQ